ncbi:hypothetical protein [Ruania alba]|uniref:hypothetical protein n=1 Tax=Ruania alba TaxID=648782 RepID=UPI000B7F7B8E|nr:hypothetical protein [Ruania alba]
MTGVGIGSTSVDAVATLFRTADIDRAMLAGRHTLMESQADAVFEAAGGRSVVIAGAFNSGILATERPSHDARYDHAPAAADKLRRPARLAAAWDALAAIG